MENLSVKKKMWGVKEVAEYLNVPISKIYSLTRQKGPNTIPRFKIGRHLRFIKEDIDIWLNSQRVGFRP